MTILVKITASLCLYEMHSIFHSSWFSTHLSSFNPATYIKDGDLSYLYPNKGNVKVFYVSALLWNLRRIEKFEHKPMSKHDGMIGQSYNNKDYSYL